MRGNFNGSFHDFENLMFLNCFCFLIFIDIIFSKWLQILEKK